MPTTKSSSAKNSFADSLRGRAGQVRGENGAWKKGDDEVMPHIKTMNDCIRSGGAPTESELQNARDRYRATLDWAIKSGDPVMARHAVVMMMAKREVRGDGEGEKAIPIEWFFELYNVFPQTARNMIRADLFGMFGCYQDYNRLLEKISDFQKSSPDYDHLSTLADDIRHVLLEGRTDDLRKLDGFLKAVSILEPKGHWAHRGIKGFEELPGDAGRDGREGRVWVLRKFLDKVTECVEVPDVEKAEVVKTYPYLDKIKSETGKTVRMPELRMVGKWVGSEGAHFDKGVSIVQKDSHGRRVYDKYLNYMIRGGLKGRGPRGPVPFPVEASIPTGAKAQWRKRNAALRAALGVTEIYMAAERFSEINFARVCARCMKINSKAFLNELRKKAPGPAEERSGNRHPRNQDRVSARANLREFYTGKGKESLNVKGLVPHEMLWKAHGSSSTAETDLCNAMIDNMVTRSKEALKAKRQEILDRIQVESDAGKLTATEKEALMVKAMMSGNFLPMCDTSGSMTWAGGDEKSRSRPWDISVALGAFLSMVTEGPWSGLMMTFDDNPQIYDTTGLTAKQALDKVVKTSRGYTTDLRKAMMTLLNHMVKNRVPEGEEPVIIVFTDGEFNEPCLNHSANGWNTTYETLVEDYAKKGRTRLPTICWWNLKSGRSGVQNSDRTKGTMMFQGRDPSMFKMLLEGESAPDATKEVVVDGKVVEMKVSSVTPRDVFLKQMTQDLWSPIDEVLIRSQEGIFAEYHGLPVEE